MELGLCEGMLAGEQSVWEVVAECNWAERAEPVLSPWGVGSAPQCSPMLGCRWCPIMSPMMGCRKCPHCSPCGHSPSLCCPKAALKRTGKGGLHRKTEAQRGQESG